ncbi:tRNA (adenosine(37)-N6)-threonylcarbamoyltransferase complex ATPase subunit type 1 TsaE, partial [Candidatus Azambacteria bacterium RIFCSPLOWO2_01_FULL_44_84]
MFERLEIVTKTADETKKTAAALGIELKRERRQINALIIALEGHLGSGKTTFIQGLAEGMGVKENVLSPTFLILKQFFLKSGRYKNLYHIDAYRLKNPGE